MQIRCASCGRAVTVAATGVLPERCPHCRGAPVPAQLGKWRIERLLAAGGMGEVYLARHRELASRVAIKLLPAAAAAAEAEARRERFAREAALTAAIDHPGVVRVLDYEDAGERAFLVLEYVAGRSLRSLLRDGPLPWPRAVAIVAATADVLAAAHARGVVHRDVKPENVLVAERHGHGAAAGDGAVRVLDFGIARALQDHEPLTRTGEILGTPEYMAPEQVLEPASAIDARTDVHALGVLAYELLTGRSPFAGPNLFAVLKLVESLVPPPPSRSRGDVPAAIDAVVLRALAKAPAERFADAAEFAAALRAAAGGSASPAAVPRSPRARRVRVGLAVAAAAGAFALGLGVAPRADAPLPAAEREPPTLAAAASAAAEAARRELRLGFAAGVPLDGPALRAARAALAAADDGEALLLRGRAALRLGAFVAAVQDLDRAVSAGVAAAREPAAAAWIAAHLLLPGVAGAPEWLRAVDVVRRDRLLGAVAANGERASDASDAGRDTPFLRACRSLAIDGDGAAAFALLRSQRDPLVEPAATVALLAATRACADRDVLRAEAERLRPPAPGAGWSLLEASLASPAALASALGALAVELDPGGADRWLVELAAAALRCHDGSGRRERCAAAAELAWLAGAGELAPLWHVGFRSALAAALPERHAMARDEAARLLRLLAPASANEHPAAEVARALLAAAGGDASSGCERVQELATIGREGWLASLRPLRAAIGSGHGALAAAMLAFAAGDRGAAAGFVGDRGPVLAVLLTSDEAARATAWRDALVKGADLSGLALLWPRFPSAAPVPAPPAEAFTAALAGGATPATLLPAARVAVQRGGDVASLRAALGAGPGEPLHEAWVREVQGGIEQR